MIVSETLQGFLNEGNRPRFKPTHVDSRGNGININMPKKNFTDNEIFKKDFTHKPRIQNTVEKPIEKKDVQKFTSTMTPTNGIEDNPYKKLNRRPYRNYNIRQELRNVGVNSSNINGNEYIEIEKGENKELNGNINVDNKQQNKHNKNGNIYKEKIADEREIDGNVVDFGVDDGLDYADFEDDDFNKYK